MSTTRPVTYTQARACRLAIGVAAMAQWVAMFNATLPTAFPLAEVAAGGFDAATWRLTVLYACALAAPLVSAVALRRRAGPRSAFLVGLSGTAATSVLLAAAPNAGAFAAGCVLEAAFASLVLSGSLSLALTAFARPPSPPARRPAARGGPLKVIGLFGVIAGLGAAAGRSVGDLLTRQLSWRWVLCGSSTLALLTLALGVVKCLRHPAPPEPRFPADDRTRTRLPARAVAAVAVAVALAVALLLLLLRWWRPGPAVLDLLPFWALTTAAAVAAHAFRRRRGHVSTTVTDRPGPDEPQARVLGSVRSDDGRPLAGAVLTLLTPEGAEVSRTHTDTEGRFALEAPGAGGFFLVTDAGTHHPAVTELVLPSVETELRHQVTLAADPVRSDTHSVTGRAWDASGGAPVPGARAILMASDGALARTAPTDEDGLFLLARLARETYTLVLLHEGYRPSALSLQITSTGPSPFDVVLTPRADLGRLEGVIRSERGTPLPGILLTLTDRSGLGLTTTTEPNGSYRFADVPVGDYTLVAAGDPPTAAAVRITQARLERNLLLRTPR
ncbi:carboxypeptidase-like regulatory domain-containing protein [Streptomyces sp. NBC_01275]|uniref:MSCRAMM family protein n=1 Tax=Streptomyces sp. NBC_01275 TaxID=2903807 RepID=UPI00225BCD65|nr:carboxypeptidase-like regulatory domain-containing protein [Streptomyces sp. NBC_01275]MCX4760233.1 carboxypeptidase-like regulatory domain-containing protein [Streptomyces sp. NBC_01275]